jgi:hypothetical protein
MLKPRHLTALLLLTGIIFITSACCSDAIDNAIEESGIAIPDEQHEQANLAFRRQHAK